MAGRKFKNGKIPLELHADRQWNEMPKRQAVPA
jgi:hypothetical protein